MLTLLRDLRRLRKTIALGRPDRGRSLAVRHVDAGSCNGCEHELVLASSPYTDLQRFGIGVVASPRHADLLLVTGPVTTRMREPLLTAYAAMPEPRLVAAFGDCALGCNVLGAGRGARRPGRIRPPGRRSDPRLSTAAGRDRRCPPRVAGLARLDVLGRRRLEAELRDLRRHARRVLAREARAADGVLRELRSPACMPSTER